MSLFFVMANRNLWLYNKRFLGESMVFYTKNGDNKYQVQKETIFHENTKK